MARGVVCAAWVVPWVEPGYGPWTKVRWVGPCGACMAWVGRMETFPNSLGVGLVVGGVVEGGASAGGLGLEATEFPGEGRI